MSFFFFSSRRRHTRLQGDWSSDVCSSDLPSLTRPPRGQRLNKEKHLAQGGDCAPSESKNVIIFVLSRSQPINTYPRCCSFFFVLKFPNPRPARGKCAITRSPRLVCLRTRSEDTSELQSPCNLVCR